MNSTEGPSASRPAPIKPANARMVKRTRLWLSTGASVLIGAAGTACSEPAPDAADASGTSGAEPQLAQSAPAQGTPSRGPGAGPVRGEAGAGEGEGAGGASGGEFGIDPDRARTDPVPYITALDLIRAHYLAGQAAYAAGSREAAAELFVHPISEVYLALEPVLIEREVEPFQDLMVKAGDLAFDGAGAAEVAAAADAVMTAVAEAESRAPRGGRTAAELEAALISDMVERAALQYQVLANGAAGEAYLDGYGFYRAAATRAEAGLDAIRAENPSTAVAIEEALTLLGAAYPAAAQPETLTAEAGALLAASSRVKLAI